MGMTFMHWLSSSLGTVMRWLRARNVEPKIAARATTLPQMPRRRLEPIGQTRRNVATVGSATRAHGPRRTVRVIRVLDSGQPRSRSGRIMISGRMDDVCAELDRMAA